MIELDVTEVRIADIHVPERQRSDYDEENAIGLAASIAKGGLINPVLLARTGTEDPQPYMLVAGLHRLKAHELLQRETCPARLCAKATPRELASYELVENVRRKGLKWQDEAKAVLVIHTNYCLEDENWNQRATAILLGYHPATVTKLIKAAQNLDDAAVAASPGLDSAVNFLTRRESRELEGIEQDAASKVFDVAVLLGEKQPEKSTSGEPTISQVNLSDLLPMEPGTVQELEPRPASPIICADFMEWAKTYSGPLFNVIHCDFPYGIDYGEQKGQGSSGETQSRRYDDSMELALDLCRCLFLDNRIKLIAPKAHIVFWCSARFDYHTLWRGMFTSYFPAEHYGGPVEFFIDEVPFIWHKADGAGIVPRPSMSGRRTYETALVCSLGGRQIVSPKAMSFSAPTVPAQNRIHNSQKPKEVLAHLLSMFIDEHAHFLDPTCGSGTSLQAARSLGATHLAGVEKEPSFAKSAQEAFANARP